MFSFSYPVQFWIYLLGDIPSTVCSFFVLYHLLFDRTQRRALHNHVIIVLLIVGLISELTNIPWILNYYRLDAVWEPAPIFCRIWSFIDYASFITQLLLFAWASVERHILIFHDQWVSTEKKRVFIHYLPLGTLLAYCLIFFSVVFFFPPCENDFDYSFVGCTDPCLFYNWGFLLWHRIFNTIFPTLTITFSSGGLLLRVLWQKHRMLQRIDWRKHRKMTIQLLSISILYIILYLPYMLIGVAWLLGLPKSVGRDYRIYSIFFSYFIQFLLPFVCAGSLPELRAKLKKVLWWRRPVGPASLARAPRAGD